MKKILSVLIITVLLANTASAERGQGKKGGPDIDAIVSTLQLDDTTATNLKTLMEQHYEERKAAHEQAKKDKAAKKAAREQHRTDLLAVLGYEKMYEFEGIMSQNHKGKGKKRSNEE